MLLSTLPTTATPQSNSQQAVLLHRVTSGHVLAIAPDAVGGLLLVKPHYVDFAGPGAAVGGEFDRDCIAVCAIGHVRFQTLLTQRDRQTAIHTRITYAEQLSAILDIPQAALRSQRILEQLTTWLPGNLAITIPADLTAGLAGVLPRTIELAWHAPKALATDRPLPFSLTPLAESPKQENVRYSTVRPDY